MVIDLTLGGLFQGYVQAAMYPWSEYTDISFPFWAVRVWAGLAMFGGYIVFLYNFYQTWQKSKSVTAPATA